MEIEKLAKTSDNIFIFTQQVTTQTFIAFSRRKIDIQFHLFFIKPSRNYLVGNDPANIPLLLLGNGPVQRIHTQQ
jgi:hypothetical protein